LTSMRQSILTLLKSVLKAKKACFACPLACSNYVESGKTKVEGPEYETLALCGSNCGIGDLEAVIEFNRLCDDYCLDTISAGNAVAFAMEMTEKGIHDFGIRFGEVEHYLTMPGLIATGRVWAPTWQTESGHGRKIWRHGFRHAGKRP
jgi:aldehyde:ferredoxin oxidoreductase